MEERHLEVHTLAKAILSGWMLMPLYSDGSQIEVLLRSGKMGKVVRRIEFAAWTNVDAWQVHGMPELIVGSSELVILQLHAADGG